MKKTFQRLLIFLFVLLIFFTIPTKAKADDDLTIPTWVVKAQLLQNGDLHIVEDLTYQFNDDFNGVFREIVLDKTSGVSNIEVQEITGTSYAPYTQVEKAKKGDQGVFTIENEEDTISIQIFSPAADESKTFRIGYVVKDVAIKYNDTGELYYKFLGDENQTPIEHFVVHLHLPGQDENDHIRVFAHGPLNGQIEKQGENTFILRVNDVPAQTFIEGRVVFPKEFIPLSNNIISQNNYENILEEEAANARELAEKAEERQRQNQIFGQSSLIATVIGMIIFFFFLILFRRERQDMQNYDPALIPEDCSPGVASYLTSSLVTTNTIMATFLDLFRKGYIKLERDTDDKNKSIKDQTYIIHKVKDGDEQLLSHESHFLDWFIHKIGNGSSVSTKEIQKFNKDHSTKAYELHGKWVKKIKEDAIQLGHFDKSKSKFAIFFILLFIPLLVLGIVTLVYENFWGIGSIILAGIFLIYGIALFYRRSDYGYEQYKKWASFKKHMKNKDIKTSSNNTALIYALGLGVSEATEDIDNLSLNNYENTSFNNNWMFWYFIFANNSNNSLAQSINQPWAGSGGSGGSFTGGSFTGGGGGGAGGGGAGGF